jgi:hypothetical protein
MSGRIQRLVGLTGLVAPLLLSGEGVGFAAPNTARADESLTAPNSPAPQGSHWYYRLDRTNQRKCWHLAPGHAAQQAAAQAASETAPVTQSHSTRTRAASRPTPAAPAASIPLSINPGDAAPLEHVRTLDVKPKPVSADELVERNAQEESTEPSIPAAPAPQESASSQSSAQLDGPVPAPTVEWPEARPTVAIVKAHEFSEVSTTAQVETIASADARSSADSEISAAGPTINTGIAGSLTSTPAVIFIIFALGLLVAGTLSRVLMKIAAVLRTRATVKHPQTNFVDEQRQHGRRNSQEYGFVDEWQESESIVAIASDYESRHLSRPDEESSHNAYGEDGAFQIEVGKREIKLAQLSQDDRVLGAFQEALTEFNAPRLRKP